MVQPDELTYILTGAEYYYFVSVVVQICSFFTWWGDKSTTTCSEFCWLSSVRELASNYGDFITAQNMYMYGVNA